MVMVASGGNGGDGGNSGNGGDGGDAEMVVMAETVERVEMGRKRRRRLWSIFGRCCKKITATQAPLSVFTHNNYNNLYSGK